MGTRALLIYKKDNKYIHRIVYMDGFVSGVGRVLEEKCNSPDLVEQMMNLNMDFDSILDSKESFEIKKQKYIKLKTWESYAKSSFDKIEEINSQVYKCVKFSKKENYRSLKSLLNNQLTDYTYLYNNQWYVKALLNDGNNNYIKTKFKLLKDALELDNKLKILVNFKNDNKLNISKIAWEILNNHLNNINTKKQKDNLCFIKQSNLSLEEIQVESRQYKSFLLKNKLIENLSKKNDVKKLLKI